MKTQFIVCESDINKREEFYNYIIKNYKLKKRYPYRKKKFINNHFPFVVDFNDQSFWVCESITCCACAIQTHSMISVDEFKKIV